MKLTTSLIICSFIFCNQLLAQTLSPVVISSSGGFSENGTAMLSSTVGEMTMVETFSNAGVILTQGFQQPDDFGVSTNDIEPINGLISLGPNPTHGAVNLIFNTTEALLIKIDIFDMRGRRIFKNEINKDSGSNFVQVNLSTLACADYIIDFIVSGNDSNMSKSFSKKISFVD